MSPKEFDWSKGNIDKNLKRHNVTDRECEEIFFDSQLIVHYDQGHSIKEERYYALGKTVMERKLFVVFTMRKNRIRVISARDMNKREKEEYGKKENTSFQR